MKITLDEVGVFYVESSNFNKQKLFEQISIWKLINHM